MLTCSPMTVDGGEGGGAACSGHGEGGVDDDDNEERTIQYMNCSSMSTVNRMMTRHYHHQQVYTGTLQWAGGTRQHYCFINNELCVCVYAGHMTKAERGNTGACYESSITAHSTAQQDMLCFIISVIRCNA